MIMLIIGLGNPGQKYKNTRHNIGFEIIDWIYENWKTIYDFSDWRLSRKFESELSEGEIAGSKIILAKPITYMNNSGTAVKKLFNFYKTPCKDIVVIHDDFDLPMSKVKESYGSGSAGHKGVESIIAALETKNFTRIRMGIKPAEIVLPSKSLDEFVLKKLTAPEQQEINKVKHKVLTIIENKIML